MELKEQLNDQRSTNDYHLSEEEMAALIESKMQRARAYRDAYLSMFVPDD